MTEKEIKENLCCYDLRNPDNICDLNEKGFGNYAKENCSCDNCFYGRTRLSEELLRIINLKNK